LLEVKSPLRSGDIIRLSSRGPDIQFTMQSGGVAIRALVDRFLPSPAKVPLGPATNAVQAASERFETPRVAQAAASHPTAMSETTPAFAPVAAALPTALTQPVYRNRTHVIIAVLGGSLAIIAISFYLSSTPTAATDQQVPERMATQKTDRTDFESSAQAAAEEQGTSPTDASLQQVTQPAPLSVETK
jgi:hypothetical protein